VNARKHLYGKVTPLQKWIGGVLVAAIWIAAGMVAGPGNFWPFLGFSAFFIIAIVILALFGSSDAR
jgi:hypothetical protein